MPANSMQFDGVESRTPLKVWYNGTDILKTGYTLCYQSNYSGSTEGATEDLRRRSHYVQKPTLLNAHEPAGVVAPGQTLRAGVAQSVAIWPFADRVIRDARVWTDENCAVGDVLGIVPGSYALGLHTLGAPLHIVNEAVDRSATNGLVTGSLGMRPLDVSALPTWQLRHFDHFTGRHTLSAPAVVNAVGDAGTYLLTGASAAAAYADSTGPEAAAALQAHGVLNVTTNTTNQANISMNGEPWRLDPHKALFFDARVALSSVAATTGFWLGVGVTDTALDASLGADFLGFKSVSTVSDGLISSVVQKGGSGVVATSLGLSMVADTYVRLTFLARNRAAASTAKSVTMWVDGVNVTPALTAGEFPDDQSFTFLAEAIGSAARTMRLDYIDLINYIR